MVIGIEDLHRTVAQDVRGGDHPLPGGIDPDGPRSVLMQLESHTLQVQNDVGDVLLDPGDRRKFMQDTVKFYGNDGCPLNR
jgi:hypothetical protein